MASFFDLNILSNTDLLLAIAIGSLALNVLVLIAILIILCRQKKQQYVPVPTQCVTRKPIRYFPSTGNAPSMVSDFGNLI